MLLSGCGYVGDPLPPALNIPARINDLRAVQTGDRVRLTCTLPSLTTDSLGIRRVESVELLAGDTPIPVAQRTPGPLEVYWPVGAAGATVVFRVRTRSEKGRASEWSPDVALELQSPVQPPAGAKADPHPEGVRLSWTVPARHAVRVLRRSGDEWIEEAVISASEWVDRGAKFGQPRVYSLVAIHPKGAESVPVADLVITPDDIFPPAIPAGLAAIPGIGTIEIAWERSPDTDVAGYRIYRSAGGTPMEAVGVMSVAAAYSDREIKSGVNYRYAVTAIDQKGNESPKSASIEVLAP